MKKVLMLASVASMIDQFNMPNIQLLQELGYEVHVACNFKKGSTCTQERIQDLKQRLEHMGVCYFQIDFSRNVLKINEIWKAYRQVERLLEKEKYSFIHCHSPIGGAVGRIAAHKTHTKVIYTAHGFHFYKGAPLHNWLIYYPIEKWLSKYTDVLITINKEDYQRAKKKFYAKKTEYIPGVGIDIDKIQTVTIDREAKRKELGVSEDDFLLLSVGELSKRKNHITAIRAVKRLGNPKVKYIICGQGEKRNELISIIEKLGLQEQVKLLGFRTDISELCLAADLFVFPSIQEGLPVALMEAIASKTPVICSKIRGNQDLITDSIFLFNPYSEEEICKCIEMCMGKQLEEYIEKNYERLSNYDLENVLKVTENEYAKDLTGGWYI